MTGNFAGNLDFDPGVGTYYMNSGFYSNIFVLKLSSVGNFLWAKQFYSYTQMGTICVDKDANVYVSGTFGGDLDLDPGASSLYFYSATLAAFVVKLTAAGNFVWGGVIGGFPSSIAVDNEKNVLITGRFVGTADFDPGTSVYNLSALSSDAYVTKLDSSGNFVWANSISGKSHDIGLSIATDKWGNVYSIGHFTDSADFDPGTATYRLKTVMHNAGGFIRKLDKNGDFVWAKKIDNMYTQLSDLAVDTLGNPYITGYFKGKLDFISESSPIITLSSVSRADVFIAMLDPLGNYIWVKQLEGTITSSIRFQGKSICVDDAQSVYTVGNFADTVDFFPGTLTYNMYATGQDNIFLHKMTRCNINSSISAIACKSYLSPSKKHSWNISGTYTDKIALPDGCDSVIEIDLTVKHLDVNVTNLSPSLSANEIGATYQWYHCDSPTILLSTSKTFTATKNGRYKVVITKDGCTDTSLCYTVANTSIPLWSSGLELPTPYPNPTNGLISLPYKHSLDVELMDMSGRLLSTFSDINQISIHKLVSGIYVLKIYHHQTKEYLITHKVIKE